MNRIFTLACFAAGLAAATSAQAQSFSRGDWVLAQWRGGAYWFPGVVQSAGGGKVTIRFDDGTAETRPANQVKAYNWRVGSRVECQWKGGADWYPGRISGMGSDGESLAIAYDDGDRETTKTGKCRSR